MLDKLKSFGEILKIVSGLLTVIIPAIEVPGWGPEKKKLVLDIVSKVLDLINEHFVQLPVAKETLLNVVGWLIDIYVAFFNKVGEFVHSVNVMLTDSGLKTK